METWRLLLLALPGADSNKLLTHCPREDASIHQAKTCWFSAGRHINFKKQFGIIFKSNVLKKNYLGLVKRSANVHPFAKHRLRC
jgi:hypothetical protein